MSLPHVRFGPSGGFDVSPVYEYADALGAGPVRIPNGDFLLSADYGRMGTDLSLSEGGTTVVVKNFFTLQQAPDLMTEDGHSVIEGSLAVKLAGPFASSQFRQIGRLALAPVRNPGQHDESRYRNHQLSIKSDYEDGSSAT